MTTLIAKPDERTATAARSAAALNVPGRPGRLGKLEPVLIGSAAVVVFIVAWQLVSASGVMPELFLPGPLAVAQGMVAAFQDSTIGIDLATSGEELGLGFGLAIVLGLPIGILMGWYRRISYALEPFVSFFYAMPRIALIPLLIIWFGIGIYSKVAVVFLGAFFPILINTSAGIRSLDSSLLRAARSFGASDAQIFMTVALPGSVPFILTGFRLGLGHALVGVVVGELVAAQHGIGLRMSIAGSTYQTAMVFAYLTMISATGVALSLVIQRLERRFDAWRPRN